MREYKRSLQKKEENLQMQPQDTGKSERIVCSFGDLDEAEAEAGPEPEDEAYSLSSILNQDSKEEEKMSLLS